MKLSVITACRNSEKTIEDTVVSVINQDYSDTEYIIVDGASTDKTPAIINQYKNKISKIISGKDGGIYYALNKGLSLATGDVIGFLHSDDIYSHNSVLSLVADAINRNNADSVYADLQYVKRNNINKVIRYWRAGSYEDGLFLKGWMPPHPTFFVKKKCYEQYGNFNTVLKSAADYELMLRFLHKHKISTAYIPEVLVKMRQGGQSNVSLMNRLKANREDRMAWELNELKPSLFTTFVKPLRKISQFFQ